ncbi:MAG: methyltransferase [Candidatus Thermoplasmatota archaeon]|nr:methyltransferase [Candidatus Thermoplasmatota archaeon]
MSIIYHFEGVHYMERGGVYPVRDDTLLLISSMKDILKGKRGKMLDMGCGTGLASILAASNGWQVVSVDREPRALSLTRENLTLNDLAGEQYLSDLFEGIPGRFTRAFDLIVFNPPYLKGPALPLDRREELALAGGREGWEITARFLRDVDNYLSGGGSILLLSCREWPVSDLISSSYLDISEERSRSHGIDGEGFKVVWISYKG